MTRHALETVGPFQVQKPDGATDYRFLCLLAKYFRTNFISLPSARKHEEGSGTRPLKHLATGRNHFNFRVNRQRTFDELHWNHAKHDRELGRVRRVFQYHTACEALRCGLRKEAIEILWQVACLQTVFWRAYLLLVVACGIPSTRISTKLMQRFLKI